MKPEIYLRLATPNDLSILNYWDTKPHVIAASPNDLLEWEHELAIENDYQEILIAKLNDTPIGVVQILNPHTEPTRYWGEVEPNLRAIDIWIGEEDNLGKGFGSAMMKKAIHRCFKNDQVDAILIDPLTSNERAIKFYLKMGFHIIEERWFDDDYCLVMRLNRTDWELGSKIAES